MWLYPFKIHYLKCGISRDEIQNKLSELTFLSDANYRRTDDSTKYFYGTLGNEDFDFETIAGNDRLVDFISGRTKGADHDIFVTLTLKAFRVRRIYAVFVIFLTACLAYAASELLQWGVPVFQTPAFLLLLLVILSLSIYLIVECRKFWKKHQNSLDFFRGLFDADEVNYKEIPVVFRL